MDKVLRRNMRIVQRAIRAGAEVIILGDDYAGNHGPMIEPHAVPPITWSNLPADDHLSPLQVDRPAVPGGAFVLGAYRTSAPLERVLVLLEEMIDRLDRQGLDVAAERAQAVDLPHPATALAAAVFGPWNAVTSSILASWWRQTAIHPASNRSSAESSISAHP